MNNIKRMIVALVATMGVMLAQAGQYDNTASVSTTNGSTTLSWAIGTSIGANGGTPVVTYLNATSDKGGSGVQFYKVANTVIATAANTTVTIPVVTTSGFTNADVVVIRHVASDTYEKRTLDTGGTDVTIKTTAAVLTAVAAGDIIYRIVTTGAPKIPVGVGTLSSSGFLYAGQRGYPIYAEVDGGTNATLNLMTVQFLK